MAGHHCGSPRRGGLATAIQVWTRRVSNLRPLACEAEPEGYEERLKTALTSQVKVCALLGQSLQIPGLPRAFGPPNGLRGPKSIGAHMWLTLAAGVLLASPLATASNAPSNSVCARQFGQEGCGLSRATLRVGGWRCGGGYGRSLQPTHLDVMGTEQGNGSRCRDARGRDNTGRGPWSVAARRGVALRLQAIARASYRSEDSSRSIDGPEQSRGDAQRPSLDSVISTDSTSGSGT
jgi:hypothetical protein